MFQTVINWKLVYSLKFAQILSVCPIIKIQAETYKFALECF